jgi:hypothetical protein
MNRIRLVALMTFLLCCTLFASCSGGGGQLQSGFFAFGERHVQVFGGGFMFVSPTNISGTWIFDNGPATGTVQSFSLLCLGVCPINNGRVPARWNIVAGSQFECIGYREPTQRDVTLNSTQISRCVIPGIVFPFTAAPGLVDLQAVPTNIQLDGEGLTTTHGMPYIEYRDPYTGNLIGATYATSVSPKGSSLVANTPDLSLAYDGVYNVLISNIRADGSLEPVGTATIECTGRPYVFEPPPDPGPCGCPPGEFCLPCEPNQNL